MNVRISKFDMAVMALILGVFLMSFFMTLMTNHRLAEQQDAADARDARAAVERQCTVDFLGKFAETLTERTTTTPELNQADQNKVRAEARMIGFLVKVQGSTPPGQNAPNNVVEEFNARVAAYFDTIQRYLTVLGRTNIQQVVNPIPTKEQYQSCLDQNPSQ